HAGGVAPARGEPDVILRVGRLVLEKPTVTVGEMSQGESLSLGIRARSGAAPNDTRMRRELLALRGQTVPVAWDNDESWAGWYVVEDVSVRVVLAAFAHNAVVLDASLS